MPSDHSNTYCHTKLRLLLLGCLGTPCGERVVVCMNGETVMIEIVKVRGSQVRVGVEAPMHVAVHRQEVWDRLATKQEQSRIMPIAG